MIKVKRRKDKYNPYTLVDNNCLSFTDSQGTRQLLQISDELYDLFNNFELQDKKIMNEYDRHTEHIEQSDEMLYQKSKYKVQSLEDYVIKKIEIEMLYKQIEQLPEIQKRRLKMYYFNNMTLEEIARKEGCSKMAVKFSIDLAIDSLSKKFKFMTILFEF